LPRSCFGDYAREQNAFQAITDAVLESAKRHTGTNRKVVRICCNIDDRRGSFIVSRVDLRRLLDDMTRSRLDSESLAQMLHVHCAFNFIGDLVAKLPRKVSPTARRLTYQLPASLRAAHTLVALSKEDRDLQRRIDEIIENDAELKAYILAVFKCGWNVQQAQAVALVDRGFRGAWEAAAFPGLIYTASKDVAVLRKAGRRVPPEVRYRDPRDVFRAYLYGKRSAHLTDALTKIHARGGWRWDLIVEGWKRLYLEKPGAAARSASIKILAP
jgi:hypothetical protein